MPSGFLCIYGDLDDSTAQHIALSAQSLLPFEAWETASFVHASTRARGWCWSCFEDAARGSYAHEDARTWTAFDGWFVEQASLNQSLAQVFHEEITRRTFRAVVSHTEGGFAAAHIDAQGVIYAARDAANAQHIFYGQRGGLVAVSNRAMLVATALELGGEPVRDPNFFAWWLSTSMAPLTHAISPWRGVQQLEAHTLLRVREGRLEHISLEVVQPHVSWDEAREAHIARCNVWRRLPGVRTRLPLTGGKDSRALLAGMIAADSLPHLDHAYLRAPEDHPDAVVAREIAARCGVPFKLASIDELLTEPLHKQLEIHLFRTESRLHSWDVKAMPGTQPVFSLGGHFGELYRSHISAHLLLGWAGVELLLTSEGGVNQHGVLARESHEMIRAHAARWIVRLRDRGVLVHAARDRWHREARMWQWATDAVRGDSVGAVTCAPLASGRLVAGYDRQTTLEQRAERTHFELMRVAPDWLWQHRFAGATWRRELLPWSRQRATPGAPTTAMRREHSRQYVMWDACRDEMVAYLCDGEEQGSFFDVFDREGVCAMVSRYLASEGAGELPDLYLLKGIYGLLGARVALDGPLARHPLVLDSVVP